jgi:lipopolysaccharide/colanic/teichoic acid biosynthesis glycosyltransferase
MYLFFKRIFDVLFSLVALVVLSPFLIPIVFLLSITGEREVFYNQKRLGYKNKIFGIIKFATMLKNSANIGTGVITLRNDPRVTPIGQFLRITKINELPQILNVLLGDMSIVGPRPLMEISFNLYTQDVKNVIYNTRPGITGIGSVIFRDEEKLVSESSDPKAMYGNIIYPYKGQLEVWYQKNISFYTDFMIIFLTVWVILSPKSELPYSIFNDLPKRPDSLK